MICPACRSENEMGYSSLAHAMVCLSPGCGFELEIDLRDIELLLEPVEELAFV
jgi:hypothetical protein